MAPKHRASKQSNDVKGPVVSDTSSSKSQTLSEAVHSKPIRRKARNSNQWISPAMKVVILTLIVTGIIVFYLKPRFTKAYLDKDIQVNTTSSPFKVVDIPGKGKGMVATRDIKRGELLLREKPLFLIPRSTTASPTELIQGILSTLTPDGRAAFDAMADSEPGVSPELSKVQTNGIAAGPERTGIFPITARLNHGCSSAFNAVYSWREKERALVVHTVRDVKAGEELLTTYTNTKRPRHERRAYLSENYHFDCTCAVCSLPQDLSKASDARLSSMTNLYERLHAWGYGQLDGTDAIATVKRIWNLMDEEGYMSERGILASDAAHVAAAHSDAPAVKAWCLLAAEWFGYELGLDSEQTQNARSLAMHPSSHNMWGSRETMEVGGP